MSKRSRRERRRARRVAMGERRRRKNRCTACRAKGDRVDRCSAGVCRECHDRVTGSWAFPECKNFGQRCRVKPVSAEESVRRGGVAEYEESA